MNLDFGTCIYGSTVVEVVDNLKPPPAKVNLHVYHLKIFIFNQSSNQGKMRNIKVAQKSCEPHEMV